jgi:hypothetical protein
MIDEGLFMMLRPLLLSIGESNTAGESLMSQGMGPLYSQVRNCYYPGPLGGSSGESRFVWSKPYK